MKKAERMFGRGVLCICCHRPGHLTIDHQRPRCLGGSSNRENLAPMCWRCQRVKSKLETEYAVRYRAATSENHRERLARQLAREWRDHCSSYAHGNGITCWCSECLERPLELGGIPRKLLPPEKGR